MENCNNESKGHQSFRSPPRRRRSTFFERRDSIAPIPVTEQIQTNCVDDTKQEKRLSHLTSYCEKLQKEKKDWKNEAIERRNNYHDLRQQYEIATKSSITSRMSYSTLTNEDIEFLKGKPNIYHLYESQQKLQKSVKETIAIMRRANELDDVLLSYSEEKVNKITEYILEHSTIEPVKD